MCDLDVATTYAESACQACIEVVVKCRKQNEVTACKLQLINEQSGDKTYMQPRPQGSKHGCKRGKYESKGGALSLTSFRLHSLKG